jgi:hypothetical protein
MSEQDICTESVRGACRVFITYSHDSPEHQHRVLALAERLRKDGVDAQLDQYVAGTPAKGWPRWMEDRLEWAQFVLVICTETYQRRFLGREEPDKGKGVHWEGSLITLETYHARSDTSKFVPVLFDHEDNRFIPGQLSSHTHYLLSSEDNYAKLYAFLTGQAGVVPVPLGQLKAGAREAVQPLTFFERGEKTLVPGKLDGVLDRPMPQFAKRLEPAPDAPADLLNVLISGEFPKQAEHRAINHALVEAERNPVDCTVFAPGRVERKQAGLLQVFLHAPEDRKQAEAAAEKFDPESKERGHRSLVLDAPIGTTFALDVEIEGFVFPERMDTLIWTGHPQSATFRFEVPEGCKWGQHTGSVRISKDGAPVGRIIFQIEVVRNACDAHNRPVGKEARHYHACFCSYSSLDREEMLKRAQGLQATGLETFIDVLKLRPGDIWNPKVFAAIDESDLFVVIWSNNARDSKWVKKEARYALKRYKQCGSPDFRPIPVEGPPIASVPRGLHAYHFNDELLGLIRAAELERREREEKETKIQS